jgi:large subunit ribosomal protein L24
MQRVRKDDQVVVIAGSEKGKRGKVLKVLRGSNRVIVEGVKLATHHLKPTRQHEKGRRIQQEAAIDLSNVMLIDPKSGDPTRVGIQTLEDGRRVRVAKKSGELIDR